MATLAMQRNPEEGHQTTTNAMQNGIEEEQMEVRCFMKVAIYMFMLIQ